MSLYETATEEVVLINEHDEVLGSIEKMEAHRRALLHRAVSVFLINSQGEWLLQRRNVQKYHSGGLWTNTCCTHPFPGESYESAAHRRLKEEMGLSCPSLSPLFHFIYKAELDNELTEHELDHIFVGYTDTLPEINPQEVEEWHYIPFPELKRKVTRQPETYTVWFRTVYQKVEKYLTNEQLYDKD